MLDMTEKERIAELEKENEALKKRISELEKIVNDLEELIIEGE